MGLMDNVQDYLLLKLHDNISQLHRIFYQFHPYRKIHLELGLQ